MNYKTIFKQVGSNNKLFPLNFFVEFVKKNCLILIIYIEFADTFILLYINNFVDFVIDLFMYSIIFN